MSIPCESAAAYVLGALSPGERASFEQHLAGCDDCRLTVADLAGLPGLLSRVSPDDLTDPPPVPDTLVPRLVREVRRTGRRRRLLVGGLVAAALALAVAGTAAVLDHPGSTDQSPPAGVAMSAVAPSPVSARVRVVVHSWGTEITMQCQYAEKTGWSRPYTLVAVDQTGSEHEIATWVVGPSQVASVTGSVPFRPEEIDRLEIRTTSGDPLLRLSPVTRAG